MPRVGELPVRKEYDRVVALAAQDAVDTLCGMPHSIRGVEVAWIKAARATDPVEARREGSVGQVGQRQAQEHEATPIVTIKRHGLWELAACRREEDGATAAVARALVVVKGKGRLVHVTCLEEEQLEARQ